MADLQVQLTASERAFLVSLLERVLKDVEVEEHRTRTPSFREYIIQEEQQITSVLQKLQQK